MSYNFSPKFLRADLSFQFKEHTFKAGQQMINASGAMGFLWYQFNPIQYLGETVLVQLKFIDVPNEEITCPGILSHEQVGTKIMLRISFDLNKAEAKQLNQWISKFGVLPDFTRKFPRIAFSNKIGFMPSRAILEPQNGESRGLILCGDIENISPKGVQVSTDDPRALKMAPESSINIELQPRGKLKYAIPLEGKIKRILRIVEPRTGNLRSYFGIDAEAKKDVDREAFSQLLKNVVEVVNALEDA